MSSLLKSFKGRSERLDKKTLAGIFIILAGVFFFSGVLQTGYIPASESGNILSPGDLSAFNETIELTWICTDGSFMDSDYYGYKVNMSLNGGEFIRVVGTAEETENITTEDISYSVEVADYDDGDVILVRMFFYTEVTEPAGDSAGEDEITTTVIYQDDVVIYVVEPEEETTTTETTTTTTYRPPPPPPPSGIGMEEIIFYSLIGGGVLIVSIALYGQMQKRKAEAMVL